MRAAFPGVLAFALLAGCVERRLWVRTEPEGAVVTVNGEKIGAAPASWPFEYYGVVVVEAELAGHERVQRKHRLRPPWYQLPVLDFLTDVLLPLKIKDEHELRIDLPRSSDLTPEEFDRQVKELTDSARKLEEEARRP